MQFWVFDGGSLLWWFVTMELWFVNPLCAMHDKRSVRIGQAEAVDVREMHIYFMYVGWSPSFKSFRYKNVTKLFSSFFLLILCHASKDFKASISQSFVY